MLGAEARRTKMSKYIKVAAPSCDGAAYFVFGRLGSMNDNSSVVCYQNVIHNHDE